MRKAMIALVLASILALSGCATPGATVTIEQRPPYNHAPTIRVQFHVSPIVP